MSLQFVPLPIPPKEYDARYFNELLRILSLYFRAIQNPGDAVVNTLRILNLPTNPTGLPTGSIWYDVTENLLRIHDDSYVFIPLTGSETTTAAGTVTP